MNHQRVQLENMVFTQVGTSTSWEIHVIDSGQTRKLGVFVYEEYVGWVLKDIVSYLDLGNIQKLKNFVDIWTEDNHRPWCHTKKPCNCGGVS